jgi:hypothetical protein
MIDAGTDDIEIYTKPGEEDEYVVSVNGRPGVGEIHPSEFMRSAIQRAALKVREHSEREDQNKEEEPER